MTCPHPKTTKKASQCKHMKQYKWVQPVCASHDVMLVLCYELLAAKSTKLLKSKRCFCTITNSGTVLCCHFTSNVNSVSWSKTTAIQQHELQYKVWIILNLQGKFSHCLKIVKGRDNIIYMREGWGRRER